MGGILCEQNLFRSKNNTSWSWNAARAAFLTITGVSVISHFSGISVIQFSPIKAQKKQPKPLFHFIVFSSGFDVFAVFMGGEDEDSEVWMRSSV